MDWAIVEIMGYLRRAGRISEVERFGTKLLQVDIPITGDDGEETFVSEFFSGASIYRLRPCTEEVAREAARQIGDPRPTMPVGFRALTHQPPIEEEEPETEPEPEPQVEHFEF